MLFTRGGNIFIKGEQHVCYVAEQNKKSYMAEHLTIDLLYHYHMDNICTCNITARVKGDWSRLTVQGFQAHLSCNL